MDLREIQRPIKDRYRAAPDAAQITLHATGNQGDSALACSVDLGRAIYAAKADPGVGGAGSAACSGDLLLGALAACAQLTCQLVAANMGIELERLSVTVDGDRDLRGTLGMDPEVPVGFTAIRPRFDLSAPGTPPDRMARLQERTERYCVVMQTLLKPPPIEAEWSTAT